MPNADYWELWKSIDDFYRVNVGDIVRYAKSRRYFRYMLPQLIENIGVDGVTFGSYLEYAAKVTSEKVDSVVEEERRAIKRFIISGTINT